MEIEDAYELYLNVESDQKDKLDVDQESEENFIEILHGTKNEEKFLQRDQILEEISEVTVYEDNNRSSNVLYRGLIPGAGC